MIVNFAERAHNHNWELDPVIRSLLDTDFYKLLMLQFVWKNYPKTRVAFALFNRSSLVRLADMFASREIAEQLDHIRKLRVRKSELVWLAGRAEPRIAASRGSARGSSGTLLTVNDVARLLQVPVSWVYDHTRLSCHDPLPVIKLGKYVRFLAADIQAYLERERTRYDR